jgi:hypothetical protein
MQPGGHVRGQQRCVHPGRVDFLVATGQMTQPGPVLAVTEDVLDRGSPPVPVLDRDSFTRRRHINIGADKRISIDLAGFGHLTERQGTLIGMQRAAPPRP